jgi:chromosomal replication initiator protein
MYLARKLTGASLPDIARRFGNRDHTTVLHAVRKLEKLSREDRTLNSMLETLEKSLKAK